MVERKSELKRRYHRKQKMQKLKEKLAKATAAKDGREREKILGKIRILSPWWKPAVTTISTTPITRKRGFRPLM